MPAGNAKNMYITMIILLKNVQSRKLGIKICHLAMGSCENHSKKNYRKPLLNPCSRTIILAFTIDMVTATSPAHPKTTSSYLTKL